MPLRRYDCPCFNCFEASKRRSHRSTKLQPLLISRRSSMKPRLRDGRIAVRDPRWLRLTNFATARAQGLPNSRAIFRVSTASTRFFRPRFSPPIRPAPPLRPSPATIAPVRSPPYRRRPSPSVCPPRRRGHDPAADTRAPLPRQHPPASLSRSRSCSPPSTSLLLHG